MQLEQFLQMEFLYKIVFFQNIKVRCRKQYGAHYSRVHAADMKFLESKSDGIRCISTKSECC